MPPSIYDIDGLCKSNIFYDPPYIEDHYYESYQPHGSYAPFHGGSKSVRSGMHHWNAPSPSHSWKQFPPHSSYNSFGDRGAGSFAGRRPFNKTGNKSQNEKGRGRPCLSRKFNKRYNSQEHDGWESRASMQNHTSSPHTYTTSTNPNSGSDSGTSSYKFQTDSSQQHDHWYGKTKERDDHSVKSELERKTKKIRSLRANIAILEKDLKRRGRQLSSTKKQVMSKHHKLTTAKTQIEDLSHQLDVFRGQLVSAERDSLEKVQLLAEKSKMLVEVKVVHEKEMENLKRQLEVSKQLLAQKDEYFRKNVSQYQKWNNELTQKNYRLTQKHGILERSYERSIQNIETLTSRNRNLQKKYDKLQRANAKLQETKKENQAQITRLLNKQSAWAVSVVPIEAKEVPTQNETKSKDEDDLDSSSKIIPDVYLPGFIFNESDLSKEQRTVKPLRQLCEKLNYPYQAIPTIPSGSVLKQIFELGCEFVHPDLLKGKCIEATGKSHPRPIDGKQKLLPSEKDQFPINADVEPWQLPDPETRTKSVSVTIFKEPHVEGEFQRGQDGDIEPTLNGVALKNESFIEPTLNGVALKN